jgi:chromosome segregation ATPase
MKLKMIFNFIFEEIAMAHRTLMRTGLVIATGTAAAQSTAHTLEEKIDTLQRQMLEMQHKLDTLREQQKTDTEEAHKRQAAHTEQVQTVKEQVTEQALNLLERVKLGGYGFLRFESNSLRNLKQKSVMRTPSLLV